MPIDRKRLALVSQEGREQAQCLAYFIAAELKNGRGARLDKKGLEELYATYQRRYLEKHKGDASGLQSPKAFLDWIANAKPYDIEPFLSPIIEDCFEPEPDPRPLGYRRFARITRFANRLGIKTKFFADDKVMAKVEFGNDVDVAEDSEVDYKHFLRRRRAAKRSAEYKAIADRMASGIPQDHFPAVAPTLNIALSEKGDKSKTTVLHGFEYPVAAAGAKETAKAVKAHNELILAKAPKVSTGLHGASKPGVAGSRGSATGANPSPFSMEGFGKFFEKLLGFLGPFLSKMFEMIQGFQSKFDKNSSKQEFTQEDRDKPDGELVNENIGLLTNQTTKDMLTSRWHKAETDADRRSVISALKRALAKERLFEELDEFNFRLKLNRLDDDTKEALDREWDAASGDKSEVWDKLLARLENDKLYAEGEEVLKRKELRVRDNGFVFVRERVEDREGVDLKTMGDVLKAAADAAKTAAEIAQADNNRAVYNGDFDAKLAREPMLRAQEAYRSALEVAHQRPMSALSPAGQALNHQFRRDMLKEINDLNSNLAFKADIKIATDVNNALQDAKRKEQQAKLALDNTPVHPPKPRADAGAHYKAAQEDVVQLKQHYVFALMKVRRGSAIIAGNLEGRFNVLKAGYEAAIRYPLYSAPPAAAAKPAAAAGAGPGAGAGAGPAAAAAAAGVGVGAGAAGAAAAPVAAGAHVIGAGAAAGVGRGPAGVGVGPAAAAAAAGPALHPGRGHGHAAHRGRPGHPAHRGRHAPLAAAAAAARGAAGVRPVAPAPAPAAPAPIAGAAVGPVAGGAALAARLGAAAAAFAPGAVPAPGAGAVAGAPGAARGAAAPVAAGAPVAAAIAGGRAGAAPAPILPAARAAAAAAAARGARPAAIPDPDDHRRDFDLLGL